MHRTTHPHPCKMESTHTQNAAVAFYLHFIPELIKKIEHNEIVQQRLAAMAEAENEKEVERLNAGVGKMH